MRTKRIIRPITSYKNSLRPHQVIDARITKLQGRELRDLIFDSVANTQKYLYVELPSELIVTQQQFASLNDFTEEMYHTTDRMFITPDGVMEVTIDREIDTIDELDTIIEESETMLAETKDKISDSTLSTKEATIDDITKETPDENS